MTNGTETQKEDKMGHETTTKKAPECPQCGSKNTGEEVKGEWYCYECGNQWEQVRGERT